MNDLQLLVPRLWAAEQALSAVAFLQRLQQAIWAVHGEQMLDAIASDSARWNDVLHPDDQDDDTDEDLPF